MIPTACGEQKQLNSRKELESFQVQAVSFLRRAGSCACLRSAVKCWVEMVPQAGDITTLKTPYFGGLE